MGQITRHRFRFKHLFVLIFNKMLPLLCYPVYLMLPVTLCTKTIMISLGITGPREQRQSAAGDGLRGETGPPAVKVGSFLHLPATRQVPGPLLERSR